MNFFVCNRKMAKQCCFVASAGVGCHIAHINADWVVGASPFSYEDLGLSPKDEVPEISIDPGSVEVKSIF